MKTLLAVICFVSATSLYAQDYHWPQWRGPDRDGFSVAADWPDDLSEERLVEMWRAELGPSYSGPIIVGDKIITTETLDKSHEAVRAYDRETGKLLWETSWKGSLKVPFFAKSNGSWIRSTPACDGERLYVAGMRDVLKCLKLEDGSEVWSIDFMAKYDSPLPAFGFVCSPLVVDNHVYVQAAGSFVKIDKVSGEVVWRSLEDGGGMWGNAFSSPAIATLQDRQQLLVQTRKSMNGVDPEKGDVLWSRPIEAFRGMNILQAIEYKGSLFTSAHSGGSVMFKPNADEPDWTNKAQAYMSTPVVIGSHAYMHLKNQRVTCIDLDSGKTTWISAPYGKYWSMVANGDRILGLDERGELYYLKANPEKMELIDSRKISNKPTWAHLASAGDMLVIRELNALVAYRWK